MNSISFKEGEETFKEQARIIKTYGAVVVVMAFDEKGQVVIKEDKVFICKRVYDIFVNEVDFDPRDIIFDPNILIVVIGIEEYNKYVIYFIEVVREIKKICPGVLISGGVLNISFSFCGNNVVREAMYSCFLFHVIEAGLDMGIVNVGMFEVYEEIKLEFCQKVEDVLFDCYLDVIEDFIEYAE